ncbi:phospholipid-translocating P-type ATPase [Thozetella sp. PMI_491]|nr:phospholipid-translocating P-type ATPase [Thozetella sp. PMI_491]
MPESPVSLTRPRQRFEQERTKGPRLTLVETREALAQSRDWVARQRKKQADWAAGPIGRIRSKTAALYESYIIRGLLRQKPLAPSVDGRHIPLEPGLVRRAPLKDGRTGKPYRSNFIRSSRYTVWDFLPKQLFFQFSKLANFYFLIIGILQMVPGLSTTGTYTTIAPLIAFVALSMAKEGYDDYRRYRLDKQENRSSVWVLDTAGATRSRAGQKRGRGLFSGKRTAGAGPDAMTELEAVGTTNQESDMWAKIQWQDVRVGDIVRLRRDDNVPADMVLLSATGPNGVAYIETMALDGETNLKSKQASTLLAKHCGSVAAMSACDAEIVSEDPNLDLYNFEGRATVNGETMPLTMNQVVYRGSTLRNTSEAVGLVINSGEECKIRMNANKDVHAKAPKMQSVVNRIVVLLVFFVILLSVGCTIGYYVWHAHYEVHANYLRGHYVPFKEIFIGFVIEFNTLIPLSLYVSLEIIKLGQLFLLNDIEMYDPVSNTPMVANTTTILENLGQVSYVFSDKTGTLTENLMRFRKMSVAGTAWLHDMDVQQSEPSKEPLMDSHAAARPPLLRSQSTSRWRSTVRPGNAQPEMKTEDLIRYLRQKPHTPFSRKARQFILCLALCHTCLPETDEKGEIKFQAASPDELALVEAAKDLGYLLVDRAAQSLKLQFYDFDGTELVEEYEIMDVIEFSSKRKRMSIVVRMPDGRLCIYTKGADSVILPRLKQHNLAVQTASAIERKASMRKSMEQEKALRRMSAGIQRESISLARAASIVSMTQHKIGASRKSSMRRSISAHRQSSVVTDEVDSWLSRREELDQPAGNNEAYYPPRPSITRQPSTEAIHLAEVGNLVDESLALNEAAVFERCFQHIDDFATEGLRTLIFAYRYLEEDDYNTWKKVYHDATTSLVNRQERIEEAAEMIEQDFDLAGATAIEDKLQQGVPDTIDKLRRANIKVWMLTGDKRETAINIAHSARICKPFSEVYILDATEGNLQEKLASTLLDTSRGMIPHTVVVIDGHTLNVVEEDESLKILLFDLVSRVDSVICCRASPSQKATLVKCIRDRVPGSLTLAIGDGANDIAMIQASHVGIGISGREGLQAARISDYSIAQFRFLQRLLFVHGRWNYIRTGKYILGTFWKEIVFYLVQAQYQRYNGYTGTSLFEPASLTVFNTLFTSLPVILLGIFEKDLQAETLLAVPELYTYGQKDKGFNFGKYLAWMFMAAAEAIIIFNVIYEVYSNALFTIDTSLFAMGACGFTVCVIFINLKMLVLELHHRTIISFLGLFISVSGWFVWNLFLSVIYAMNPGPYLVRNAFLRNFGRNPVWWFTGIAALGAVLTFEIWVKSIRRMFWPSDQQLMQEIEHYKGVMDVLKEHAAERGEAGAAPFAMTPADNSAEGVKKSVDIESVKTVGSSPNSEMAGWAWDPTGGDTSRGRQPATAGKRASRLMAEEYVPPPFTPPAEEKENPMEAAMGASSTATPSIWVGDMNSGATPDESMLTQSPIELRIPPRRGRSGKNSPGSTS